MRCVSYTRSVSGCPALEMQKNAIGQQNEAIKEYIKRKGWKLVQKYSDRKQDREEDAAFLEMKKDGMERKFDCVVVNSLFYCGKNITAAVDVLYTIFYPFDIHFAVVEDNFCSADVSAEEVEAYLKKVKRTYRGEITSRSTTRHSEGKTYNKYGYVWVKEEELVIDPEAAAIVKEIFALSIAGKSAQKIAKILNERGLENPMQYRYRMLGKDTSKIEPGWKTGTVQNLMDKKIFTGEWVRCVRGKTYTVPCPVIIEQDLFAKSRKEKEKRRTIPKGLDHTGRYINPFVKLIVDKETNHTLNVYEQISSKEKIFRFRYPAPRVTGYEKLYISCDEVTGEVMQLLALEKKKAQIVKTLIENGSAEVEKEKRKRENREKAVLILEQMASIEQKLMENSRVYEANGMSHQNYEEMRNCLLAKQKAYDAELQQNIDAIKELEKVFSLKNPWLQLFQSYSEEEPITAVLAKKYLDSVLVYRFQSVEIVTRQQEWREKLPQEWFADLEER